MDDSDNDSSDEEPELPVSSYHLPFNYFNIKKATGTTKRKPVDAEQMMLAKKMRMDSEDPNLDPVESRQLALMKLQKKIEEMKGAERCGVQCREKGLVNRKHSGKVQSATDYMQQKKLKRQMSKMKLKDRLAQQKKKKAEESV